MKDPPIRVVSEQTKADIEKNRARDNLGASLRLMAANLLRVMRGSGKSYEMPSNLMECMKAFQNFYDAHGHWPDSTTFQQELDFDDTPTPASGASEEQWVEWSIASAETEICRASLRLIAGRLLNQSLQENHGRKDLFEAVDQFERARESRRELYAAKYPAARKPNLKGKKSKKKQARGGIIDL